MLKMTKKWIKAATIRAVRTAAQAALAAIGSATMFGEVDWRVVGSTALLAAIVSVLMSIKGLPEVENGEGDGE
jgi:hypothetical protein